jgi:hypothetical protein
MKKFVLSLVAIVSALFAAKAQRGFDGTEVQAEFGITAGVSHYFGDLNTRAAINRPKPAFGSFYKKAFGNYLGIRVSAHYAQVGYSDVYSKNTYQKTRNLSFNSDIYEFALHGDFNFFKYIPADPDHNFTPYITIGIGVFSYNPYAYLDDKKIYLRPLGTEGQNIGYKDAAGKARKPYGSMSVCIPVGIGFKYSINNQVNFSFQLAQRLTTTDYLDDVSSTFVGKDKFTNITAGILQDRSPEKTGLTGIGVEGRQRGFSKQKDQYIIAEMGLSFNISTYKCPAAN